MNVTPVFSSNSFIVLPLTFGLYPFWLNFFIRLRYGSNFILLRVDTLSQHHLLKRRFLNYFGPLVENQLTAVGDSFLVMILDICFSYCWLILSLLSPNSCKCFIGIAVKPSFPHLALVQMEIGAQMRDFIFIALKCHLFSSAGHSTKLRALGCEAWCPSQVCIIYIISYSAQSWNI